MKPIIVLGAHGQVGRHLCALLGENGIGLTRQQADLGYPETLSRILDMYDPAAVINAAAYTQVDKAEEEAERAFTVNGKAPGIIAAWCKERNIPFIHYSTDYVFDGSGTHAWKEDDNAAPISIYGKSKREGEMNVEKTGGKYLIFRTSGVYDAQGKNFVNSILRLALERDELKVVADQYGAPAYAPHLAQATLAALRHASPLPHFPSGIYHLCNQGVTNWYDFAKAIVIEAKKSGLHMRASKITPISSAEYPSIVQRPANSRLDCAKAQTILGISLPSWQEGLTGFFEAKHAHH